VRKLLLTLLCCQSVLVSAQEPAEPRIDPVPRWDPDVVKTYLEKQSIPAAAPPAPAPAALPSSPTLRSSPKTLLDGLDAPQVLTKLGKPSLDRRDGRVRLLQFTGKTCVLDVLFWRAPVNPSTAVQHMEARTLRGDTSNTETCLRAQLASRGQSLPKVAPPPVITPPVATPTPPAPSTPAPETNAQPLPPRVPTALPAPVPTPTPPLPAPGLSYPLGGPLPPK
jgi:hypothetical protein